MDRTAIATRGTTSPATNYVSETDVLKIGANLIEKSDPYVLFSGGKDSLVALHMMKKILKRMSRRLTVIHTDTGISTPGNRDYVVATCEKLNVRLVLLSPRENYFTLVKRWGFPTLTRRWCKWQLKVMPVKRFLDTRDRSKVLLVDGVRGAESWIKRRMNHQRIGPLTTMHNVLRCPVFHPIYDWSNEAVEKYVQKNELEVNPLYSSYGKAFDCWCSVYKRPSDLVMLKFNHPSMFQDLIGLEQSLTSQGSALFDRSRSEKIYLKMIDENPDKYIGDKCSTVCACMTS